MDVATRKELQSVLQLLWKKGRVAELKLHRDQLAVYDQFLGSEGRKFVLNCSRRWGKSYLLCLLCIEAALQKPNQQIRYAAPTAKMVRSIVTPLMRQILGDCPKELRPELNTQDGIWHFRNGSEIHIAGCDNGGAERLRGVATDLAVVDEAGFIEDLEYLLKDILFPQTLTTNGRIFVASTPSRTPDHYFRVCVGEAQQQSQYAHRTIFDNPLLGPRQIREAELDAGGTDTTTWRREYLAEFVVDENSAIIPEFIKVRDRVVGAPTIPPYRHTYVAMDVGFLDLTAVLFGYWDFAVSKYVIEDELILNRMTTDDLARGIQAKERALWGDLTPVLRVSDTDLIVIHDLSRLHGLKFQPTAKDDKEAQVNAVRLAMARGEFIIHPRCTTLIAHLENGVWNKQRTQFDRSSDHGHFDAIDALVYFVRNVNRSRNPYPIMDPSIRPTTHYITPGMGVTQEQRAYGRMFGRFRRRWASG